jgi:cellulose synthase/poly-beta-1,6-N-acetylglucosamine synthase-like glycosyltransferase
LAATITTIIPTFRRPLTLRRAIESVLAQTYRDVCVRVYDNASGDETGEMMAAMVQADARLRYTARPVNVGAAENFIQASADVDTPFVSFLSDDDRLLPDFFTSALRELERYPQAGLFAGSTLELDAADRVQYAPLAWWPREGLYEPAESVVRMLGNRHPTWTGIVFRSDALRAAGGLDRAASMALDLDAELRVAARYPIVISFAPSAIYAPHVGSVSAVETPAVIPSYERIIANIEAIESLPQTVRERAATQLQRQLRMKLVEIAVKAQLHGDPAVALESATLLRSKHGPWWLGFGTMSMVRICSRVSLARRALGWLDSTRRRGRAARAARFEKRHRRRHDE